MSAWEQYKASVKPWDLIKKTNHTTEEIAKLRFEICKGCEFLIKATNQCKKCGCFMHLKTKLSAAECPIGKWSKAEE